MSKATRLWDVHARLELEGLAPDPPARLAYRESVLGWHPGTKSTVRQWFRQMRAADFERATGEPKDMNTDNLIGLVGPVAWPWNLFDTQKVVDRETAAHYLGLDLGFTLFGMPVVCCEDIQRTTFVDLARFVAPGTTRGPLS